MVGDEHLLGQDNALARRKSCACHRMSVHSTVILSLAVFTVILLTVFDRTQFSIWGYLVRYPCTWFVCGCTWFVFGVHGLFLFVTLFDVLGYPA